MSSNKTSNLDDSKLFNVDIESNKNVQNSLIQSSAQSSDPKIEMFNSIVNTDTTNETNNVVMNQTSRTIPFSVESPSILESELIQSPILQLDRFSEMGIHVNSSSQMTDSSSVENVAFTVQGQEYTAIKAVLSQKSPLFNALFKQKPSDRYILSSIDAIVFETALSYIKTGRIGDELSEHAASLLEVAHKFDISNLKDICEDFLLNNLSIDTVIDIFLLADKTNCSRLKHKVMQFIDEHCPALVDSNEFQKIIQHSPQLGLQLFQYVKSKNIF